MPKTASKSNKYNRVRLKTATLATSAEQPMKQPTTAERALVRSNLKENYFKRKKKIKKCEQQLVVLPCRHQDKDDNSFELKRVALHSRNHAMPTSSFSSSTSSPNVSWLFGLKFLYFSLLMCFVSFTYASSSSNNHGGGGGVHLSELTNEYNSLYDNGGYLRRINDNANDDATNFSSFLSNQNSNNNNFEISFPDEPKQASQTNKSINLASGFDTASDDADPPATGADALYSLPAKITLSILAATTSLITICGNMLVMCSFFLDRQIRNPTNYFILSLSVSDFLIGLFSMPLLTLYLMLGRWPFGEVICNLWLSLDYTVCLTSIYTVLFITIDRFCSVKMPAKYRKWRTPNKIIVMVLLTWIIPVSLFFTSIFGWSLASDTQFDPSKCDVAWSSNAAFSLILVLGYFWSTLIVMLILYVFIYQVARNLERKSREKHRKLSSLVGCSASNTGALVGAVALSVSMGAAVKQLQGGGGGGVGGGQTSRENGTTTPDDEHDDDMNTDSQSKLSRGSIKRNKKESQQQQKRELKFTKRSTKASSIVTAMTGGNHAASLAMASGGGSNKKESQTTGLFKKKESINKSNGGTAMMMSAGGGKTGVNNKRNSNFETGGNVTKSSGGGGIISKTSKYLSEKRHQQQQQQKQQSSNYVSSMSISREDEMSSSYDSHSDYDNNSSRHRQNAKKQPAVVAKSATINKKVNIINTSSSNHGHQNHTSSVSKGAQTAASASVANSSSSNKKSSYAAANQTAAVVVSQQKVSGGDSSGYYLHNSNNDSTATNQPLLNSSSSDLAEALLEQQKKFNAATQQQQQAQQQQQQAAAQQLTPRPESLAIMSHDLFAEKCAIKQSSSNLSGLCKQTLTPVHAEAPSNPNPIESLVVETTATTANTTEEMTRGAQEQLLGAGGKNSNGYCVTDVVMMMDEGGLVTRNLSTPDSHVLEAGEGRVLVRQTSQQIPYIDEEFDDLSYILHRRQYAAVDNNQRVPIKEETILIKSPFRSSFLQKLQSPIRSFSRRSSQKSQKEEELSRSSNNGGAGFANSTSHHQESIKSKSKFEMLNQQFAFDKNKNGGDVSTTTATNRSSVVNTPSSSHPPVKSIDLNGGGGGAKKFDHRAAQGNENENDEKSKLIQNDESNSNEENSSSGGVNGGNLSSSSRPRPNGGRVSIKLTSNEDEGASAHDDQTGQVKPVPGTGSNLAVTTGATSMSKMTPSSTHTALTGVSNSSSAIIALKLPVSQQLSNISASSTTGTGSGLDKQSSYQSNIDAITKHFEPYKPPLRGQTSQPPPSHHQLVTGGQQTKRKTKYENRARKALRTITFIMGAFVICFAPWHIVSIINPFCEWCTTSVIYTHFFNTCYFLCYLNSPINPFMYALANQQFRKTFFRILKGDFKRL